jgi:anti-sigma factor RsiW
MKESRFIELLNLYVDGQLSPSEAAELEREISTNASRRTTYQQYCRIQKGCTLLFEQERVNAPASHKLEAALLDADRKIIGFPDSTGRSSRGWIPLVAAAAAACVAVVVVQRGSSTKSSLPLAPAVVVNAPAKPAEAAADLSQPVVIPAVVSPANSTESTRREFYSVFATRRPTSEVESTPRQLVSYGWMRDVDLSPLPSLSAQQLVLPTSTNSDSRVLRSSKPVQADIEMTAFQFQR